MTHPSSTSSSEAPFDVGRVPWALLIAVALLVLVEVAVRVQEPSELIPYENTGRNSYGAIRHHLESYGAADVAFLGSSRGREAVVIPDIAERLRGLLGREVRVANYSSPAASADEAHQITRIMFRVHERRPRVLLLGVTVLQLSAISGRNRHRSELWYVQDWWREKKARRNVRPIFGLIPDYQFDALSDAIRLEVGRWYKTFAYRNKISLLVREWTEDFDPPSSPIDGQLTDHQVRVPFISLESRRISNRRVISYLAKRMRRGEYPLGRDQQKELRALAELCRREGVQFVIFEIPMSEILRRHLPEGTVDRFLRMVIKVAETENVPFVRLTDIGVEPTNADFREQSHLNLPGALKLSRALTDRVIAPYLADGTLPSWCD